MEYEIKKATLKELEIILGWAAAEGWNPGLYDAGSFYAADKDGFLLGLLNKKPVSAISVVKYGSDFGFLGLYIVRKEFRGRGFGLRIWNEAIKYLNDRNIGLDGVISQQENYKKSGFTQAYRNIRYEGKTNKKSSNILKITEIEKIPLKKLIEYDRKFFPANRTDFLKKFIIQPLSYGFAYEENIELKGYGMIRKCRTGYKIGPLFADNEEIAQNIFISLQNQFHPGTQFFLDVPEVNKEAIKMAESTGMKPMFETARMYNKVFPKVDLKRIFGITTFELG